MGVPYTRPRQGSISSPLRIAVLISGGGSGLLALLNYQRSKPVTHITKLIISDNENAKGLQYGNDFQISTMAINLPSSSDRIQQRILHEDIIHERLIESNIELIVLNGYMRILTPEFVKKWKGRLINIHPSLLPKYPGANAQRDALDDGAKITGCTVHLVDEGVDTGEILAQSEVPIFDGDTIEILQERVKKAEHLLYPKVLDDYCGK
ncbi:TPA: phosphoribosylglycinamide formyltransferase [Candidatus Thalassarchaeaceae archaeon]|jgi:formyltetrahydrofolate-dependent phosphoribosylglycinamide formyltransferase|nr:phosphoribosylglycinamide formyltransferase [Euryarchaeota archaeon]MDG1547838.1 phosphoribosylglycinamide formyltransferase [Candidatus Thalassarchaeaceae archaeon]DAC62602.1 MAG TPA: phosphoribosylglycinamide formyltransferase [Candidatus Poseidoniales archaeon]MBT6071843.1 phosphoribosylglycinamide formyltransferase [Euryarchaeota archaeon]MDB4819193.1 phosphoribosylglycinamide formyltransferase [Euryarchaeota archaeon]